MKHILLLELFVVQKTGSPVLLSGARRAVSLGLQGLEFTVKEKEKEDSGIPETWEIGTVMHASRMQMLGRREVCADEGHVIPDRPTGTSFGCRRCDYVFTGQITPDRDKGGC